MNLSSRSRARAQISPNRSFEPAATTTATDSQPAPRAIIAIIVH